MITQASISVVNDGQVLIITERTGMNLRRQTEYLMQGSMLRIGQGGEWRVELEIEDQELLDVLLRNPPVSVIEADDDGFAYHTLLKELST